MAGGSRCNGREEADLKNRKGKAPKNGKGKTVEAPARSKLRPFNIRRLPVQGESRPGKAAREYRKCYVVTIPGSGSGRDSNLFVTATNGKRAIAEWVQENRRFLPSKLLALIGLRCYRGRGANTDTLGVLALCGAGKRCLVVPLSDLSPNDEALNPLRRLLSEKWVLVVGCGITNYREQLYKQFGIEMNGDGYNLDYYSKKPLASPPNDIEDMANENLGIFLATKSESLVSGCWSGETEEEVAHAAAEAFLARKLMIARCGLQKLEVAEGVVRPKGWLPVSSS